MKNKNLGLLICTIVCIIITVISLTFNVILLTSRTDKNEDTSSTQGLTLSALTDIKSIDLSSFEKSTTNSQNSKKYDVYSKQTDFFGLGHETTTIQKDGDKFLTARISISTDKTKYNSVEELNNLILEKLNSNNQAQKVSGISKIIDEKPIKIEKLSNEDIKDATSLNIIYAVNQDVKEQVSAITANIRLNETKDIVSIVFRYEKPEMNAQPNKNPSQNNSQTQTPEHQDEHSANDGHNH